MRTFFALLMVYVAFLIQTAIIRWTPDLVILLLLIFALYASKGLVLGLAVFAGFCLDLVNPQSFGFNLLICLLAGFGVNVLREILFYGKSSLFVILGMVLLLKYLLGFLLLKALPPLTEMLISGLITLVLIVPLERLIRGLFPNSWKPG